ncbi:MAG: hypothetical protein ACE5EY_11245, partial [Anaerolineae bacterium]
MSSQKPGIQSLLGQRPYRALIIFSLILLVSIIILIGLDKIGQRGQDELVSDVDTLSLDGSVTENVDALTAVTEADIRQSDWWQTVQADIQASEYHINWQDNSAQPEETAAYQAPNRANNFRTTFTQDGIRLRPRTKALDWNWGLTLVGYGYDGNLQPIPPAEQETDANKVTYRRQNLTEWYVNDERGLEQGFVLHSPPPLPDTAVRPSLVMALHISGDLHPEWDEAA